MMSIAVETMRRLSLQQGVARMLRALPIPGGQKWRIASIIEGLMDVQGG